MDERRRAERRGARERSLGVDPDDDAARWLAERDPQPEQPKPKALFKSKLLHQWRQRQQRQR